MKFENNSNETISGEVNLRVMSSQKAVLQDERKPLACAPHKTVHLNWTLAPKEPDFYTVNCSASMNGAAKSLTTALGYAAKSITSSARSRTNSPNTGTTSSPRPKPWSRN